MILHVSRSYRWNADNTEHIAMHGIEPEEAEQVVDAARPPYPRYVGDEKWLVWGQTVFGLYLQVAFLKDPEPTDTIYVIHARPMTEREKRLFRRQRR